MTDQKLNLKVAELAGWTKLAELKIEGELVGFCGIPPDSDLPSVPQYTEFRDAIIGLIDGLNDSAIVPFYEELACLVGIQECGIPTDRQMLDLITATARDLCEAYVKVMGGNQ